MPDVDAALEWPDAVALGQVREYLRANVTGSGVTCPACTQWAKVYARKISSGMARDLITMWRTAGAGWFRIPEVLGYPGGDAAKLRYWGLIDPETATRNEDADGNRRTRYRVTKAVDEFIRAGLMVRKYALVFDGALLGLDGEHVTIETCLGDRFSLRELLDTSPDAEKWGAAWSATTGRDQ